MSKPDVLTILSYIDLCSSSELEIIRQHVSGANDRERVLSAVNLIATRRHTCPHCAHQITKRWGSTNGLQRFRCSGCGRTYTSLTGTPLAGLHSREQWIRFSRAMSESLSISGSSHMCSISRATAFRWRHRFLGRVSSAVSDQLDGLVELDETYVRRSCKGDRHLSREPRRRGGRAASRGLASSEFVAVLVAKDRQGNVVDFVLHSRTASGIRKALNGRVAKSAILCVDGGNAVAGYAFSTGNSVKVIDPKRHVHEKEPVYHIQGVNSYHRELKEWLRRFRGVATKYLQNYLGWYRMRYFANGYVPPLQWIGFSAG